MGNFGQLMALDIALAIGNFTFAIAVLQISSYKKKKTHSFWFTLLFIAMGFVPFSKAVVNYFVIDSQTSRQLIDTVSLLIIGLAGTAAWNIGAKIICNKSSRKRIRDLSIMLYVIYSGMLFSTSYDMFLLLMHNVVATVFLLYAFVIQFYRRWQREVAFGVLGVFTLLLAMIVNQMNNYLSEDIFSFALFFNIISLASSLLIYYSARPLIKNDFR